MKFILLPSDLEPIEEGMPIGCTPDLPSLLRLSVDEIGLGDESNSRLRKHGLINVGRIANSTRDHIASILGCDEMVRVIDSLLADVGLSYDMNFDPLVLSDEEYH